MLRWINKRLRSNKADSILVPALILFPLVLAFMSIAIDTTKSHYVKDQREQAAEQAAKAGISAGLNSQGTIHNWDFVPYVVNAYMNQRNGYEVGATAEGSAFDGDGYCAFYEGASKEETPVYQKPLPYFKITVGSGRDAESTGGFSGRSNFPANGKPSIEFELDEIGRGSTTIEQQQQWLRSFAPEIPQNQRMNSITVEVLDYTAPLGFSPLTFMNDNRGCQYLSVSGSSISFGTTDDLE